MLTWWSLMLLVLAMIAALLGIGGVASRATAIGQVCFFTFLVAFVASLIRHLVMRRHSAPPL
jgi:uncharacterized membrane protein YtjA (UPF0391 family)